MNMELNIYNLTVSLFTEGQGVRIKSDDENVLLANQNIDNVAGLMRHNFQVVKNYYENFASASKNSLNSIDVYCISLSIVLHYLYMYNSWKVMYKNQENRDLNFDQKDFDNPSTHDIIFHYLKSKYPDSWRIKSAELLAMELDELEAYYNSRKKFYNK